MAERLYTIRGKSMTAAQVAEIDNPTEEEKRAFAKQAGLPDSALQQIEAMAEALGPLVKKYVTDSIAPLADRICQLETRPPVEWEVFDETKEYRSGVFVTHNGGMWISRSTSKGVRPGSAGQDCWRLCVKSGGAK
ncbi:hypothetical protein [Bradyrhizobium sp. JYMT SZCCT0428]|uniref:hypothetical protein n=1 Tax=Bradyrhizobium sp. JYMT SZCCT0428 TaxID=2807673 RepID=UPI001BAD0309|nr:hypothetical protein [Bradyrhizobium sp. JYMT SZCCT0428]MBR1151927.1 hypothetical protein [Bradyrhizobium sp. JYMT SZCCT0428]